jgi:hypothetical protein
MKEICSSRMSVGFYQTALYYIPEDRAVKDGDFRVFIGITGP